MATPDKPSQSSSNGSKNGSGDNTVAFIVIAAIVVLAVQYFLTGTNFALDIWEEFTAPELSNAEIAEFEETLDQIDQNAATYASGGFQTEEDVKNAIAAQKSYAKELEAQRGRVLLQRRRQQLVLQVRERTVVSLHSRA